jgi:hypothetical protein
MGGNVLLFYFLIYDIFSLRFGVLNTHSPNNTNNNTYKNNLNNLNGCFQTSKRDFNVSSPN